MTIPKRWLLVTLIALALTQGGVAAVRALYEPRQIRTPRESVTNLPIALGDWQSSKDAAGSTGMDPKMLAAVFADDAVTRLYTHQDDQQCSVHLAVWHQTDEWMPHPPYMCYDAAGFTATQTQPVELSLPDSGEKRQVGCTRYKNSSTGQSVMIMYWYQMGDRHYLNRSQARDVRRSYWGNHERPPLIKVLLQIPDRDKNQDQARMTELAAQIYEVVRTL